MKKSVLSILILALGIISLNDTFAADGPFPKMSVNSPKKEHSLYIKERDYQQAKNEEMERTGKFNLFYIDFRLGYGSTSPSYDVNNGVSGATSEAKGGFYTGAFLTLTLFDMLNFTTGLDFTKKNFGITADSLLQPQAEELSNSYLNIPITFNFGGQISDKVGLNLSAGPYFGFLLGGDNNIEDYGLKNFDFGIDATLTGDYALNQFVSIILGGGAQFGGLNNLGSTMNFSNVKTTNWKGFTGLRVGL
jgi:hypothetical protein